jgi:hypothetical protein
MKREQSKEKNGPPQYRDVEVDAGIKDKRLLVRQSEFFGALQVMRRQGNTLSPVIRDAWGRGDLNSLVKNSPAKAAGAHISIIGNIAKDELLRGMLRDEADNGFSNRLRIPLKWGTDSGEVGQRRSEATLVMPIMSDVPQLSQEISD